MWFVRPTTAQTILRQRAGLIRAFASRLKMMLSY